MYAAEKLHIEHLGFVEKGLQVLHLFKSIHIFLHFQIHILLLNYHYLNGLSRSAVN